MDALAPERHPRGTGRGAQRAFAARADRVLPDLPAGGGADGLRGFARLWLPLGVWPAGPAWFLWVLFADGVLVALASMVRPALGDTLATLAASAEHRPARFALGLIAASGAAYVPMALLVGPLSWMAWGPFTVQTSRVLHYFVYLAAVRAAARLAPGRRQGCAGRGRDHHFELDDVGRAASRRVESRDCLTRP